MIIAYRKLTAHTTIHVRVQWGTRLQTILLIQLEISLPNPSLGPIAIFWSESHAQFSRQRSTPGGAVKATHD